MKILKKVFTHYITVTILVMILATAIEKSWIPFVGSAETIKSHSQNAILGLLTLQIPILIFIFEAISRVVFIRRVVLHVFELKKLFIMVLLVVLVNFLFSEITLISLSAPLLLAILDFGLFLLAYNLVSQSGFYDALIKDYLEKVTKDVCQNPDKYLQRGLSRRGVEVSIPKQGNILLNILDDIDQGLGQYYGESFRSNHYKELVDWLTIVTNLIDAERLNWKQNNIGGSSGEQESQDIYVYEEYYLALSSLVTNIFRKQLNNILKKPDQYYSGIILGEINTALDKQIPRLQKDEHCNPVQVVLSEDVITSNIYALGEFLRLFAIYQQNSNISSEHIIIFQDFLDAFERWGQLLVDELAAPSSCDDEDSNSLANLLIHQYLWAVQNLALFGLSYNQYVSGRIAHVLKNFRSYGYERTIDKHLGYTTGPASGERSFSQSVDCSILMFYFYAKYKEDIWGTSLLKDPKPTVHYNDALGSLINEWSLKDLTSTVIACYDNHREYTDSLPGLLREYDQKVYNSYIQLLWGQFVLDKSRRIDMQPSSYANKGLLSQTTFFKDFGDYGLFTKTELDKCPKKQKQNLKQLIEILAEQCKSTPQ